MEKLVIDFGKHKGRDLDEVPASYLLWMFEQKSFEITKPEIYAYIKRNLKAIQQDAKQEDAEAEAECDATIWDTY